MPFLRMKAFGRPSPSTQLWRHIPLYQFLSLLETRAVWFSAISKLEDRFEGSYTLRDNRRLEQLERLSQRSRGVPAGLEADYLTKRLEAIKARSYVSCWYMGDDESAALWQRTARTADFVAIQTTYRDLEAAFKRTLYVAP